MNGVMVRHDADLLVTIKCDAQGHDKPCNVSTVKPGLLDAHLTVQSIVHGKVSGYDSGVRVRASYKLVNPERDILKDGQLCPCSDCLAGKYSI